MALKPNRLRVWLSRLHLLVRLLGVTGLVAVATGAVLAQAQGMFGTEETTWGQALTSIRDRLLAAVQGQAAGDTLARVTVYLFLGGVAAALLWLLVEVVVILRFAAARRSAFGANAVVQGGIAAALLVGINLYSYSHYRRVDCTRTGEFTLPSDVQKEFRELRPEAATTILVLLQPAKAVSGNNRDDNLAAAAEKIVITKVRELADELRDFGPQFQVIVLDTREEDFPDKLKKVTRRRPGLTAAIENAPPGNNIYFYAPPDRRSESPSSTVGDKQAEAGAEGARIQRISFEDFYQLDRTRSKGTDKDRGNLVLLNKGVGPLARRILNLEEKRPRIGILVVHEAFSTISREPEWKLAGLKSALTRHGFDVRDVILKRNFRQDRRTGELAADPAVSLLDETRYKRALTRRDRLPEILKEAEKEIKEDEEEKSRWEKATPRDLEKFARNLNLPSISEAFRQRQVEEWGSQIEAKQRDLERLRKQLDNAREELKKFDEDIVGEQLRMTDLRAKLERVVADCDLLLIARPSLWQFGYPDDIHRLDAFQIEVIRDFLKSGKPLLACLGSRADPPPRFGAPPPPPSGPDSLEELLAELHIKLNRQTIVFNAQTAEDIDADSELRQSRRDIPPLDFKTKFTALRRTRDAAPLPPHDNPIRESLVRSAEVSGGTFEFAPLYPRPVYYAASSADALGALGVVAGMAGKVATPAAPGQPESAAEFLWTDVACWNEENPLAARRFVAPKKDDPTRGTREEKRRGPFPVGVAVEVKPPAGGGNGRAGKVRVAVIGHGAPFAGTELSQSQEKVLLDTCNWLLRRGDLLTEEGKEWSYPRLVLGESEPATAEETKTADETESRLSLAEREKRLWLWGARLGLPALFAWLGVVVLLVRRAH
jgi:hypothetical protein